MEVKVPDIGDFKDVPVISILVAVGDEVTEEQPLIELESDKATMEVPSPAAGRIAAIAVKPGDRVSEGALILRLEAAGAATGEVEPRNTDSGYGGRGGPTDVPAAPQPAPAVVPASARGDVHAEVVVLGSGPGGYTAAFRTADLGKKVVLIERNPTLGGVCLNVGCIPSKALLHAAKVITEAEEMADHGIAFDTPVVDLDKLRGWKDSVVKQLTGGLSGLAKGRKVQVVTGYGRFTGLNMIEVERDGAKTSVSFDQCIIAAGSEPVTLPFIPHDDPRVIDSTGALELDGIPERMLVLGGGIIGLEMACVYDALGTRITVVELMDQIIPGADKDIVGHRPAQTAATILRAGDRERGSIQTAVSKAFEWMQSDNMRHFLARSSFRMDDLLDDQVDLFIVVPLDQVDKQAIFMRLFINLVLGTVVRQDGRRKVKAPILLVLDEFVRMGRMEQIMNIANVAAGAGVEALFVTQDTGQVEKAYGPSDARSIFGSCITKRVFNLNDIETAEWAARHLGESTVYSQQIREGKAPNEGRDFSYSEQRQKLMTAEQITGMKADDLLLLVGNRNPLKAKQNVYFKTRAYRGRFDQNPLN